jgi:hypothetical protein
VCFAVNHSALRSRQHAESRGVFEVAKTVSLAMMLGSQPRRRAAQRAASYLLATQLPPPGSSDFLESDGALVATDSTPTARPVTPAALPSIDLMRILNKSRGDSVASAGSADESKPRRVLDV